VDQSPNRLKTLLTTIAVNRISVVTASVLWYFMVDPGAPLWKLAKNSPELLGMSDESIMKGMFFSLLLLLGIVEELSASGNMLSMERDWIVVAAAPSGKPYDLTHLNSTMRRIDLICKLIAPIIVSLVISTASVRIGVIATGLMSITSWGVEIWCARKAWALNSRLRAVRPAAEDLLPQDSRMPIRRRMLLGLRRYAGDLQNYFSTNIWLPSIALSLLHLSVLSYGATFVTFLLSTGTSLEVITIARAAGSVVEISSTVVTPIGVRHLGKAYKHGMHLGGRHTNNESTTLLEGNPEEEGRIETGLERLGLWGLSWQLLNLVSTLLKFERLC